MSYTAEQTTQIVNLYAEGVTPEAIAAQVGKSVKSVISKLAAEKVYQAKSKGTTKAKAQTKADLIAKIAAELGIDELQKLESLNKATSETLQLLVEKLSFTTE